MSNLKQTNTVNRVTPAMPSRTAVKRQTKDNRKSGEQRRQPKKGHDDGHRIDEYA